MSTVRTKIAAGFILEKGKPRFVESEGYNHYEISFHIEDAPPDTYAVTYYLHETYFDPVREIRNAASGFQFQTTSYGDYTLTAKIRTRTRSFTITQNLYKALLETHKDSDSSEIQKALQDIHDG